MFKGTHIQKYYIYISLRKFMIYLDVFMFPIHGNKLGYPMVPRKSWTIPNVSKCCMFALQLPLPWSFLMSKYVEMSCIRTLTRHQLQITDFDNFDSLGCAICPWAFMEDICSKWRQNIADDANGCASCKPCLCWYLARENTPFIIYRGFTRWSIPYILATHGKSRF